MKITNIKADRALNALGALNGFKFSSEATWKIAAVMVELEDALRPYYRLRDRKIAEISNGKGSIDPAAEPDKASAFTQFMGEMNDKTITINASQIDRSMLSLDENQIPLAVVVGLMPLMAA